MVIDKIFKGGTRVTQPFGARPEYYKERGVRWHEGTDMVPSEGPWDIYSPAGGIVTDDVFSFRVYGHMVGIFYPSISMVWYFCHLQKGCKLSPGAFIQEGDRIGVMGETGETQGAHLHLMGYKAFTSGDLYGSRRDRNNGTYGMIDLKPFLEEEEL